MKPCATSQSERKALRSRSIEEGAMKRGTTSKSVKEALRSRSVEEGASGKRDLMTRRVPKDAAIGRKAGKSRRVKNLSTKSTFEAKKPAAKPAAAVPAVAAESDTTCNERGLRLPKKFVDSVLSWEPEFVEDPDKYYARAINDPAFSRDYVERRTKTLRDLTELFKRCADMMEEYKAWVRAQYEEKGYVEVDDDYIAQGIRLSQELEEDDEFPEAFGPMDGLISDETPQSVIDEIVGRISAST